MLTYEYYRNNPEQFSKYHGKDMVPLNCCFCNNFYYKIQRLARTLRTQEKNFCSKECQSSNQVTAVTKPCGHCQTLVTRTFAEEKAAKRNVFCNHSCAAKYNNVHKTTGSRRSKLETYLEEQLKILYPNLQIICNGKETIESELDFYFPELRFAIELNGIVHYEPIYGQDKFERIQSNDKQKMIKCSELGIELMVISVADQHKFTVPSSQKYLDIVKNQLDLIMKRKEPVQTL